MLAEPSSNEDGDPPHASAVASGTANSRGELGIANTGSPASSIRKKKSKKKRPSLLASAVGTGPGSAHSTTQDEGRGVPSNDSSEGETATLGTTSPSFPRNQQDDRKPDADGANVRQFERARPGGCDAEEAAHLRQQVEVLTGLLAQFKERMAVTLREGKQKDERITTLEREILESRKQSKERPREEATSEAGELTAKLQEAEAKSQRLNERLASMLTTLDKKTVDLERHYQLVETLKSDLRQERSKISGLEATLAAQRRENTDLLHRVSEAERKLDEQRKIVRDTEHTVAEKRTVIADLEKTIAETRKELAVKSQLLATANDSILTFGQKTNSMEQLLNATARESSSYKAQLDAKDAQLQQHMYTILERETSIRECLADAHNKAHQIREGEQTVARLMEEGRAMEADLKLARGMVEEKSKLLTSQAHAYQLEVNGLRDALSGKERRIADLERQVKELERRLKEQFERPLGTLARRMSVMDIHKIDKDKWVPDNQAARCSLDGCKVEFSWLRRKHHCRRCMKVFCAEHTSKTMKLAIATRQYDPIQGLEGKVCDSCYKESHETVVLDMSDMDISVEGEKGSAWGGVQEGSNN